MVSSFFSIRQDWLVAALLKVEAERERDTRDRDPSDEFSFIRRVWI